MQKHYQQKYCLQCRDVTFHFRQMLLGLPGIWQNIWLIVLQVLLCSPWKINTLSFHYRQAIRHRTIQMKSKSNLERKLQNICLSFYLRKLHCPGTQQQHDQPWNRASAGEVHSSKLKSQRRFGNEHEKKKKKASRLLSTLGWVILCTYLANQRHASSDTS